MKKKKVKTELLIHDLKNPLAIIETGINMLLRDAEKYGPLTERQTRVLGRSMRNAKIAMGLVNDILEIERSGEGMFSKEECRFYDILKIALVEIYDLFYPHSSERIGLCKDHLELTRELAQENIHLAMDDLTCSKTLCLDSRKIQQIIRNLLSNAMKFRRDNVYIITGLKNNCLRISIRDDGHGINRAFHEKIFENYFQLGNEREQCVRGHGVGLAGCLILVEDMGGKMEVESEEEKGATFTVSIPLREL